MKIENLAKDSWTKKEISEYRKYIAEIKGDNVNCNWEQRIVNTALPCSAQSCTKARLIASKILKGSYIEFLETITFENLLKLVVTLMNQFYVPMKAIVLRLVETSFFKTDFAELFLGYDKIPDEFFTQRKEKNKCVRI